MVDFIENSYFFEQSVAWGDMDAFGHVNNVVYYRYVESARIAYLDQMNIWDHPIHIVVASSQCKYFSPVVYPDILKIKVKILEIRNSAFNMGYTLWSEKQQKIVAESEAVIVCVNQNNGTKVKIPEDFRNKLIILEKKYNNIL